MVERYFRGGRPTRRDVEGAHPSRLNPRMSPELTEIEPDVSKEKTEIRRWRRRQFMRLGLHLRDAQRLMDSPVDVAEMRRLVHAGCPPEMAQRILL
jgi:hypothetical protein